MSAKTKWVQFTMVAYAKVAVEVPEGTKEEMEEYADQMAFDGICSPSYDLDETRDFEVLESEPSIQHCRNHDIDRNPMDDEEKEELGQKQKEGGVS